MTRKPRNGLRFDEEILTAGRGTGVAPGPEGYVTVPVRVFLLGILPLLRVDLGELSLRVAPFHEFLTPAGWVPAEALRPGTAVALFRPGQPLGEPGLQPLPPSLKGERTAVKEADALYLRFLAQPGFVLGRVASVEEDEPAETVRIASEETVLLLAKGGVVFHV